MGMAREKKMAAAFLILLAFILQPGFCAWTQDLGIGVSDADGKPIADARIWITYQKDDPASYDGLLEGRTSSDGIFTATIANSVPLEFENRNITVEASTGGYSFDAQIFEAGGGPRTVMFVAKMQLEKYSIMVLQAGGAPSQGAIVQVGGSTATLITGADGRAEVYLPAGTSANGVATFGEYVGLFDTAAAGEGNEIVVQLGKKPDGQSEKTLLSVAFFSENNAPIGGEKAALDCDGSELAAYTDANGVAIFEISKSCEARAAISRNGYNYSFSFNATADGIPKRITFGTYQLLKIDAFESRLKEDGCHFLFAQVSDPRKNRPITVKIVRVVNGVESELPVTPEENGAYTAILCAAPGTIVKAYASNIYEAAEKTLEIEQAPPPKPPEPEAEPQKNTTAPPDDFKIKKVSADVEIEVVLVGIVLILCLLAVIALILNRKDSQLSKYFTESWGVLLGSILRPIIVYLRSLRKKEPPQQAG
jgi:hypothetical protein